MEFTTNTHDRFGAVRTAVIDGRPWIVAGDLCPVLGYAKASALAKPLDADERRTVADGCVSYIVLNKQGFYHACLNSDSPDARPLMRWISNKVLPEAAPTNADALDIARAVADGASQLAAFVERNLAVIQAASQMREAIKADVMAEMGKEGA